MLTLAFVLNFFVPVTLVSGQEKKAEEAAPKAVIVAFEKPVKADMEKEFVAFVGEFRATVDGLIKEGKLTEAEKNAFEDFRVLRAGVQKEGVVTFSFFMDPWQKDVSFSMTDYFTRALGEETAQKKNAMFQAMLAGPPRAVQFTEY